MQLGVAVHLWDVSPTLPLEHFKEDNSSFSKKKHKSSCLTRLFVHKIPFSHLTRKGDFKILHGNLSDLNYPFVFIIVTLSKCFLLGLILYIIVNTLYCIYLWTAYLLLHQGLGGCCFLLCFGLLCFLLYIKLNVVMREMK